MSKTSDLRSSFTKKKQNDTKSNCCFMSFLMKIVNTLHFPDLHIQLDRSGYENNLQSFNTKKYFSQESIHTFLAIIEFLALSWFKTLEILKLIFT